MDWTAAIETNRQALKRVLAGLRAMAQIDAGDECPEPLPRILHRAVLRLLRPAEAAARRLVIVAARRIEGTLPNVRGANTGRLAELPPPPPRFVSSLPGPGQGSRPSLGFSASQERGPGRAGSQGPILPRLRGRETAVGGGGGGSEPRFRRTPAIDAAGQPKQAHFRRPCLALFDPPTRIGRPSRRMPACVPRISFPGITRLSPVRQPPAPFDQLDARGLSHRLAALADALDNLPRHAQRFARWQARRNAARMPDRPAQGSPQAVRWKGRVWPIRNARPPGRPPARDRSAPHEVHAILETVHGLALWVLEPADTS